MGKRTGPKRKLGAKRYRAGQTVHRTSEERVREVRAVGETARRRVYGLTEMQSTREEATDAIGRAYQNADISKAQLDAAREYEKVQRAYSEAILATQMPSGGDLERMGGYDSSEGTEPPYVDFCEKAIKRMSESRNRLLKADPLAQFAVNAWVLEDKAIYSLLGELRVGLNALVRLYAVPVGGGNATY